MMIGAGLQLVYMGVTSTNFHVRIVQSIILEYDLSVGCAPKAANLNLVNGNAAVINDSRLIHGQVMTKWVNQSQANKIVVVSDELAADEFMREIYLLSKLLRLKHSYLLSFLFGILLWCFRSSEPDRNFTGMAVPFLRDYGRYPSGTGLRNYLRRLPSAPPWRLQYPG